MQFLTGLNEKFSVVKTQILLLDPLPSLNKVYSLVIQEESNSASLLPISVGEDTSVQLNASDARRFSPRGKNVTQNNSSKPARYCTFCHRNNHTVDFCYEKHGYPNGNKPQPHSNNMVQAKSEDNTSSASLMHPQVPLLVFLRNNMLNLCPCYNKQAWLPLHLPLLALLQTTLLSFLL